MACLNEVAISFASSFLLVSVIAETGILAEKNFLPDLKMLEDREDVAAT